MNGINLTGAVAGCGTILLFIAAYAVFLRSPAKLRLITLAAFAIFAIPSLLVAGYYLGFPLEKAWFYEMRSYEASEFLILPAGIAAGLAATFLPRLMLALPLAGLMAIATIPYLKPVIMPLADDEFLETWKDGACIQSTSSTCGPSSVNTILRLIDADTPISEKETARAAHTYQNGTEAWYLARYLRRRGYHARFDFREHFSTDVQFPAMVGVRLGSIGHFIPVLSSEGDQIVIADPLHGRETISHEEFHRRYGSTGFHMAISVK